MENARNPKSERLALAVLAGAVLVIVVVLTTLGDRKSPVTTTTDRLQELKAAVISYAEKNGAPPTALGDLQVEAEMLTDHIGVPFKYSVDGSSVKIVSYGADKKQGGWFFKRDFKVEFECPAN